VRKEKIRRAPAALEDLGGPVDFRAHVAGVDAEILLGRTDRPPSPPDPDSSPVRDPRQRHPDRTLCDNLGLHQVVSARSLPAAKG